MTSITRFVVMILSLALIVAVTADPMADPKTCAEGPAHLDEVLGMRTAPGAFDMNVHAGSPAAQIGLEVCDLIVGFNGEQFRNHGDLATFVNAMRDAAMFSGVDLEVWKPSASFDAYHPDHLKVRIPLQQGARIGASTTFQVLITAVDKNGPADASGVRVGEFIHLVNGQKVSDMRSIVEVDQRIQMSARQDGQVVLTLAQWKPVRDSAEFKTSYVTREVVIKLGT